MKPRIFKTSTFAAIVLSLATMASCVKDSEHSLVFGEGEGLPVVISLAPAIGNQSPTRTRGYHDGQELEDGGGVAGSPAVGNAKDTAISDIMVLLYQSSSGIYAGQDRAEVDGSGDPVSLDVLTGTYDIVVVANAFPSGSDATNGSFLGNFFATPANYDQIGEVKNALLDAAAFGESKNIPMFTIAAGVHIGLGGVVNNIDTNSTAWSPTLTRAGVRLSLEITLTKWQHEGWLEAAGAGNAPKVTVSNVPAQNWLHDETGKPNDAPLGANRTYGAAEAADASDPQPVTGFDGYMWHVAADAANNIEEHWIVRYDRIILPEFIPADKEDDDTAMHLSMDLGDGNVVEGEIRCSDLNSWKEGYSLRRNTWLHLDVEVAGARLDVSPQVIPWNNTAGGGEIGDKYWLRVDSPIYIGAEATAWFSLDDHVTTNHSGGYEVIPVSGNNVTYPVAGPSGWLEIDTTTLSYSATSKNEDSAQREAYVRIKAGDLEKEITFIQLPVRAGIHASPGVIGVIVGGPNDGELTLRGSAAYKADARIADAAKIMFPGPDRHQQEAGLSNHNVFVTTFKWGSLVALGAYAVQEHFEAGDVIWVPEEYEYSPNPYAALERLRGKIGSKTDEPAFDLVPGRRGTDARDNLWKMEPVKGLGDPCTFYFGNKWRLPVYLPSGSWNDGVPFGGGDIYYTPDWILGTDSGPGYGAKWIDRTTPGNTLLPHNGAVGGDGQGGQDWSWFLPTNSWRDKYGISIQGETDGRYWSSSVSGMDASGEAIGVFLWFNQEKIDDVGSRVGGSNPVRCVKIEEAEELAPIDTGSQGNIIYFVGIEDDDPADPATYENNYLSLGTWGNEIDATNYLEKMAYFKWGSVVGMDLLSAHSGVFNSNLAATNNAVKFSPMPTASTFSTYGGVPYAGEADGATFAATDYTNTRAGKGDPCKLIGLTVAELRAMTSEDDLTALLEGRPDDYKNWRMPDMIENCLFTSGTISTSEEYYGNGNVTLSGGATAADPLLVTFLEGDNAVLPAAGDRGTSGAVSNPGKIGYYWSATPSSTFAYSPTFGASYVSPANWDFRSFGRTVRCVVNQTRATMLDVSAYSRSWNHGMFGVSFEKPVVVTSDGAWTVTLSGDDAAHFKVTSDTGDISGTIENGAGIITGSGTATFKVTPVSPVYGGSNMEATITVIANGTSLSQDVTLTHWGVPE